MIAGPTATGKTAIAEEVCRRYDGEIISADTGTFHRGMNIGTGKSTLSAGIRYHLIDIIGPTERYTSLQFATASNALIDEILDKGKLPIICGGSIHYILTLIEGLDPSPPPDEGLRETLGEEAGKNPPGHLHDMLGELDPELASKVHPNNTKRIIRYIEKGVWTGSGDTLPPLRHGHAVFFTFCSRELHEERIRHRTREMLDSGWIDEVRELVKDGRLSATLPVDPIGYNVILDCLEEKSSWDELEDRIVRKTLKLSRKQSNWRNRLRALDIDIGYGLDDAVDAVCRVLEDHPAV